MWDFFLAEKKHIYNNLYKLKFLETGIGEIFLCKSS